MKKEISAALDLLSTYVQRFGSIKDEHLQEFRAKLEQNLFEHYQGHWYPDKPIKGQAFRSLEFNKENDYCDSIVSQICQQLGFAPNLLGIRQDLTLWIDPCEVTIRLGNHASPKENQQLLVARFDTEGNELIRNDLDILLSQSRVPLIAQDLSQTSATNSTSYDSASCSGSSTPQRTSSPFSNGQSSLVIPSTSMFRNGPLFTPPRALSPRAPEFQMSPSAPIKVPAKHEQNHFLQNTSDSISCEGSPIEGNNFQPDRSDTPHSVHSTTSNESSDSGYCGYVESFPYYYKLNRLYKALAIQKLSHPMGKTSSNPSANHHHHHHHQQQRRIPAHNQYKQQQQQHIINHNIPTASTDLSSSPPTPTPMNIHQFSPFYTQQSSYLPMPTTVTDSRKSKY